MIGLQRAPRRRLGCYWPIHNRTCAIRQTDQAEWAAHIPRFREEIHLFVALVILYSSLASTGRDSIDLDGTDHGTLYRGRCAMEGDYDWRGTKNAPASSATVTIRTMPHKISSLSSFTHIPLSIPNPTFFLRYSVPFALTPPLAPHLITPAATSGARFTLVPSDSPNATLTHH